MNDWRGTKLKEFPFRTISPFAGLSIRAGKNEIAMGYANEVIKRPSVIALADREIESTNWYFDTFVIRLKED